MKERMLRLKGNLNEWEISDAYSGVTMFGWEIVQEGIDPASFSEIISLGIVKMISSESVEK